MMNWSGNHQCTPQTIYRPHSVAEVHQLLSNPKAQKMRLVGRGLSPNGIGFNGKNALLSLENINHIRVDKENLQVTVGSGATVRDVLRELSKHNLTLCNFSSIQEQQIGGWTQVAAHGTGAKLSTVDEMITQLQIVTPAKGILNLSNDPTKSTVEERKLFQYAKVGLGCLGAVTELTLSCSPEIWLHETTSILQRNQIDAKEHLNRLQNNRHVRYMWLPFTNTVVNVMSKEVSSLQASERKEKEKLSNTLSEPNNDLFTLAKEMCPTIQESTLKQMSFAELRDFLLDVNPLDVDYVARVNKAEAGYWKSQAHKERTDRSTQILGFDCGGQQLVLEMCIPMKLTQATDLEFVEKLLKVIERNNIPAPSPIEQRWTSSSSSPLSPAFTDNNLQHNDQQLFTWVGIIMYLPPNQSEDGRKAIQEQFQQYSELIAPLVDEYKGTYHWAKLEIPIQNKEEKLLLIRKNLAKYYGSRWTEFLHYRSVLDPKGILTNDFMNDLLDL